jgi:serine/threonine protein kinase
MQALHIFLEFVPGGSIASLLSKFGPFAERVISVYTRQILEGLEYLHRNQIMHRDIKGANILVDNAGCVKLADFGASRQLADLVTMESGFKSMKGTPYWMAPEVIKQTGHGRQADIWSVGCTTVEMATAKPPWSEYVTQVSALFHIASAKGPPPLPASVSPEARDFMLLCFNRVPKDRPNATRLLQHPFVAGASAASQAAPPPPGGTPIRRTVSTIPEGASPSSNPSTGGGLMASAPRYTPAGDAFSSLGSEAASSPGDSDEAAALDSLRRRLELDAGGGSGSAADAPAMDSPAPGGEDGGEQPAPGGASPDVPGGSNGIGGGGSGGIGASPALSAQSLDSGGGYNPMEEPSWSPDQAGLTPAGALSPPQQHAGGSSNSAAVTPLPMTRLPQPSPSPAAAAPPPSLSALAASRGHALPPVTPPGAGLPPRFTPRKLAGSTNSPVARAVAALERSAADKAARTDAAADSPSAARAQYSTSVTPMRASLRYGAPPSPALGTDASQHLAPASPSVDSPADELPPSSDAADRDVVSMLPSGPPVPPPPLAAERSEGSLASSIRVSDETIDSLLARAEQQSVAAREEARRELRRSKQAQWEAELQRELEAQRAEQRAMLAASGVLA